MRELSEYQLLDSGDGSKLEQLGPHTVLRQATQAFWQKKTEPWSKAVAVHHRSNKGGGHWEYLKPIPDHWHLRCGGLVFKIKLTSFGHIGLFPEQQDNWQWIAQRVEEGFSSMLNLFGYTGGSSLAAARSGGSVTHVDASKGVVAWARENQTANGLERADMRWLVDDAGKFLARQARRGASYSGVVLDPPTFGRGNRGEVFRIETDLAPLLRSIKAVIQKRHFGVLSCHTPGFTPLVLENMIRDVFDECPIEISGGEMVVFHEDSERPLPSGTYVRWIAQ